MEGKEEGKGDRKIDTERDRERIGQASCNRASSIQLASL